MPLKACAYRKKGMMFFFRLAELNAFQFVRCVCGAKRRAYLVRVSDQRGPCLVEKPEKKERVACVCSSPFTLVVKSIPQIHHPRKAKATR